VLIVTDIFDLNMLTESCDLEFKAIDLATAKQLLKVVPYEVVWSSESREVEAIKLHYDTTVLVIDAHYHQGGAVIDKIWLISPLKFT